MINKLTIKQEKFCLAYIENGNASESFRSVYGCGRMKPETINRNAFKLTENDKIIARIAVLRSGAASRNEITVDRILKEYAKLAFTDLPGIIKFDGVKMMVEDFDKLTVSQRACIQSFKVKTEQVLDYDDNGKPKMTPVSMVEVKLYSKQAALDKHAEFMGIGKKTTDEDEDSVPVVFEVSQTINIQNNYSAAAEE